VAVQSFLNAGFRSATQEEFVIMNGDECLHVLQRCPAFRVSRVLLKDAFIC
jgi:hypothetical protein